MMMMMMMMKCDSRQKLKYKKLQYTSPECDQRMIR